MAKLSLNARVGVIATLTALPILAGLLVMGVLYARALISERTTDLERTAVSISEVLNNRIATSMTFTERLAEYLTGPDQIAILREQALFSFLPAGATVVVHNLSGAKLFDSQSPELAPSSPSALAGIRKVLETNASVVTPLYRGQSGTWRVSVLTPLRSHGKIWAVLGVGLSPEQFGAAVGNKGFVYGARWAIVDTEGVIISRSREAEKYVGTKIPARLLNKERLMSGVSWDSDGVSGEDVVRAWSRVPATGWLVAVVIPQAIVLQPGYFATYLIISILAAALSVFMILLRTLLTEVLPSPSEAGGPLAAPLELGSRRPA